MAPHALRLEPAAADRARKHILHRPEGRPRTPKWPQDSGVVGGARPCCPLLLVHGQGHRPTDERNTQHTVKYDRDNSVHTHDFMPRYLQDAVGSRARWTPALPTQTPPCPKCGAATRGGTGASTGRLSYTCDTGATKCACRDPSAKTCGLALSGRY